MRISGCTRFASVFLAAIFVTGIAVAQTLNPTPAAQIQSFQLTSAQSGWLLAGNRLFFTTDLGTQWSEITPATAANATLSGVYFRPDGNGWALESTQTAATTTLTLAHTADNGAHWTTTAIASPFTDASVFNGSATTYFPDAQHGFLMLGVQSSSAFRLGILLRTTDGGATWQQAPAPPVGGNITFLDATHGFDGPGPAGNELYRTADGANTWQRVTLTSPAALATTNSTIALPLFTDATHGTLLRTYNTDGGDTILTYTTSDGGVTWSIASTAQSSTPTLLALARDGSATNRITATASVAGLPTLAPNTILMPTRSSFATANNGWVEFKSGNCVNGTCTQTDSLRGTLDGGRTYFSLGQISGIQLDKSTTFTVPTKKTSSLTPLDLAPASASVYNTSGVMGFDACSLPTVADMSTWITASPYRVAGIYIGGENFACSSGLGSLTKSYVSTILAQGWQMEALWVGLQGATACSSTCSNFSTNTTTANAQGVTEANSAVAAMIALGLGQGSTIVYDMEAYAYTNATDLAAAQAFLDGWNTEIHAKGYISAVYSSHPEFDTWIPGDVTPAIDDIWFAYFFSTGVECGTECQTVFPTQDSSFDLPANYWLNNHRARQTSSGFEQTYGGVKIDIDEDWVDAPMVTATPNLLTVTTTGTGTVASTTITNTNSDSSIDTAISCGSTCSADFAPTDTLTLVATPGTNYTFGSWTGCTTTSGSTCTVLVSAAKTVTATFTSAIGLTVTKAGTGTGTVTSADSTINCGTTCSASYTVATNETLTAVPNTGSTFTSWTGCTSATGATCVVDVTSAAAVTATFTGPVTLTVAKAGTGSGTVTSADSQINCGITCTASYATGTITVLTATPATGSTFTSWSGCTTSTATTCSVTMAAAENVTATFTGPVTLTVAKAGTGTGTVTSADSQINCGSACSTTYATGTITVLTAVPASGSTFASWSGCTTSTGTTCSVTMAAAENVTATFTGPVPLTVTKAGTGSGTVTSADTLINCGATCSTSYAVGSMVTLTASPSTGSIFASWSGCTTSTTTTCSVTMAAAETVTATFTATAFTAATTPSSLTITAGQSGTTTLTFTPTGGYTGSFSSFSCTGLTATVGTCSFSPTTLTATGNNAPLTTTLTISTSAVTAQLVKHNTSRIAFAGLLLPAFLLPFALRRKNRGTPLRKLVLFAFVLATLGLTSLLTGCGGSSSPATNTAPVFNGTIQINYTASTNTSASQLPLQLTINQ